MAIILVLSNYASLEKSNKRIDTNKNVVQFRDFSDSPHNLYIPKYAHSQQTVDVVISRSSSKYQTALNGLVWKSVDIYGYKITRMEQFVGIKYLLKSSTDNFESYLKFINVGFLARKAALSVSPVAELSFENDVYTLTITTVLKTIRTSFKIGEEFDEERADGVTVKSILTVEGNKLIQNQIDESGRKSLHIREFTPDTLSVTTTAEGWDGICTRVYKKIEA